LKENKISIKKGVKLHLIKSNKFKTDLSVIFITVPLDRNTITKDVLISEVLKSGCAVYSNQLEISKRLDNLYGTTLETGTDKTGKNLVLKIYTESINDSFIPENNSSNLIGSMELLFNIIFNPLIKGNSFNTDYVDIEKERRIMIIESEKDDKDAYSYNRTINKMYGDCGYGLNKNGYLEDLNDINSENLYKRYKEIINVGKIDIFISGNIDEELVENWIRNNKYIVELPEREDGIYISDVTKEKKEKIEERYIQEEMDVVQGKLVIGLDIVGGISADERFVALLFNTILGDGANSKFFRIVREQESLAYTCKSNYIPQKSNFFVRAGIDIENYKKALNLILKQIDDIKNGIFEQEDLDNAKRFIYAGIDGIKEEQSTAIIFYYGEEMSANQITVDEYYEKIESVTIDDIINLAKKVEINMVYFLKK